MIELIGASAANQILGMDPQFSTLKMDEYLKKHGVSALGKDSVGLKWNKSDIESLAKKIEQERKEAEPVKPSAQREFLAMDLYTLIGIEEKRNNLNKAEHKDALEKLETIIKQGQFIYGSIQELNQRSNEPAAKSKTSDVVGELAGFVGSYLDDISKSIAVELIDIKASLTRQMDSALGSIDDKLETMQRAIAGHTRLAGDLKQGIADIHKMAQNTTTNHNQTSKRLSEDITKGLARVEQAIDQMSK